MTPTVPKPSCSLLCNSDEQTHHGGEQGDALDESGRNDHVRTDVAGNFGLAGDGGHGVLTDVTHADTGTDGGQTCADTGTQFPDTKASSRCLQ